MPVNPRVRKFFTPFVMIAAFLYFVLDLLFELFLRPINRWLARNRFFARIADWIASLGPYPTLALFLVPLILLEPTKLAGLYLIASGHLFHGIALLAVGGALKVIIVERIFQIGRPKLMMIPAFAWTYNSAVGWLNWLAALPAWQAVKRQFRLIVGWIRSRFNFWRPSKH